MSQLYRKIPKIDVLLEDEELEEIKVNTPYSVFLAALRDTTDELRTIIQKYNDEDILDKAIENIVEIVKEKRSNYLDLHLRKVINGSGVVLHTNLGRAVLDEKAVEVVANVVQGYSNLEYDLEKGERGSRYDHMIEDLINLTGAEDALVVNNNAAAVLLVLSTMAKGKEVITSRGELIEIGGAFRIPAVMEESGAFLREVGTTNKTHKRDYEEAINEETAALLRVHTSNYRIIGFTSGVSIEELVQIREKHKEETDMEIPIIEDLGSGVLLDLSPYGLPKEPTVQEAVASGADIVTFSGDKLLGGPQAGIIVGKSKWIEKMRKNHLTRALRIDKFTIAALEYTLKQYLDEESMMEIPVLRMLTESSDSIKIRAERLVNSLSDIKNVKIDIVKTYSTVGGGSMPEAQMETYAVRIQRKEGAALLEKKLRFASVPVISRVQEDCLLLDMRTISENEIKFTEKSLREVLKEL